MFLSVPGLDVIRVKMRNGFRAVWINDGANKWILPVNGDKRERAKTKQRTGRYYDRKIMAKKFFDSGENQNYFQT